VTKPPTHDFNATNLCIGLNGHKKNWGIAIRCNGIQFKRFNMIASTNHLAAFLNRTYPNANFIVVYETGFCEFWICRSFGDLGIKYLVVNPADIPISQKAIIRIAIILLSRGCLKNGKLIRPLNQRVISYSISNR
jgi:hypothetical protein